MDVWVSSDVVTITSRACKTGSDEREAEIPSVSEERPIRSTSTEKSSLSPIKPGFAKSAPALTNPRPIRRGPIISW